MRFQGTYFLALLGFYIIGYGISVKVKESNEAAGHFAYNVLAEL